MFPNAGGFRSATRRQIVLTGAASIALSPLSMRGEQEDDVSEPVFDLAPDITPPKPIHIQKPDYGDRARKMGIQGKVMLGCIVTSQGVPKRIAVIEALEPELDNSAAAALRQWTFQPATKQDKPLAVRIRVEFEFGVR
jgi:TonB family protein